MDNPNIELARERKAVAMARFAIRIDINPDALAVRATDEEWKNLAKLAGVNPPGSVATKERVVEIMREFRSAMKSCDEIEFEELGPSRTAGDRYED
jgi:hypothetical protein